MLEKETHSCTEPGSWQSDPDWMETVIQAIKFGAYDLKGEKDGAAQRNECGGGRLNGGGAPEIGRIISRCRLCRDFAGRWGEGTSEIRQQSWGSCGTLGAHKASAGM